jgi:hypothetical protein
VSATEWQCLNADLLADMIHATTDDQRVQTCYSSAVAANKALEFALANSNQRDGLSGVLNSHPAFKVGCGAYDRAEVTVEVPAADWYISDGTEWGVKGYYADTPKSTFR